MTPRLLQDWVTVQAYRQPEATAVVSAASRLTYADLDDLSGRLAALLRENGCRRGDRVALLMPKSPMAIVGLLGIYKADCVYVPIDPSGPVGRLEKILRSCDNRWVLAAAPADTVLGELVEYGGWPRLLVGWLDSAPVASRGLPIQFTLDDVARHPLMSVASRNGPNDPAHILFTSGSTGSPKGVVISHAGVIAFIEWAVRQFQIDASDRLSGHPPLQFDISFLDMFGAFAAGGALHLIPPELNVLPNKLADFIRASALTQWFSVPAILNYLAKFDVVRFNDFPALKRVLWAGEVLPTPALIYWMQRLPHVTFTNLYGPTETTIASSYYTVPACPADPRSVIPIGTACDGERLRVLDGSLRPVEPGATGELCISGVGLALGYWRDPDRTNAAFPRDPGRPSDRLYRTGDLARVGDDGLVYFLGRRDSQIKARGYRIELGEIEAALNTIDGIQESAVVAIDTDGFESAAICCAYVPAPVTTLTPTALQRSLGRLLPRYMLPAHWLAFEQFPKNANGKIDRNRIKDAFWARVAQAG